MAETTKLTQLQQTAAEEWRKFVAAQVGHVDSILAELAKLEAKGAEQVMGGLDEAQRIAKESLALAGRATAEWRKMTLEAVRRTAEILTPKH